MIKNEKQYKIGKGWIKHFEATLAKLGKLPQSKKQPWLRKAQRNSIEGQLQQLRAELAEYEALKSGKIKVPDLTAADDLPGWLIRKRIARGWTLQDLATRLGIHHQQIQRYEQSDYATATLATIQRIAAMLSDAPTSSAGTKSSRRKRAPLAGNRKLKSG
jgi:ribosome-binding protein aMBF1 (putative translation factor)